MTVGRVPPLFIDPVSDKVAVAELLTKPNCPFVLEGATNAKGAAIIWEFVALAVRVMERDP
jgi:hypothetical protein